MGGHAFDANGFSAPRMPPEVYQEVKARFITTLREHFRHVDSPIEAPAKLDHGDIDVLVCEPLDAGVVSPERLARLLGAIRWKSIGDRNSINFAVPWPATTAETQTQTEAQSPSQSSNRSQLSSGPTTPTSPNEPDTTTSLPIRPSTSSSKPRIIQLDISILPTLSRYTWLLFLHAHGDLWTILGSTLRRYSFICTPTGFYVIIPEIERQNKNLSRVKITDQPGEVLRYMGLDEERYWRAFGSWDEMLDYACTCRFVDLGRGKRREEHERREAEELRMEVEAEQAEKVEIDKMKLKGIESTKNTNTTCISSTDRSPRINGVTTEDAAHALAANPDPKVHVSTDEMPEDPPTHLLNNDTLVLRSNDRQRAAKRPLFAYFLTTYISKHADKPSGSAAMFTKEQVIDDLKAFFGNEFAERYDSAREEGLRVVGLAALWVRVRAVIKGEGAEGGVLGYGIKGVKSLVDGGEWGWVDGVGGAEGSGAEGSGDNDGSIVDAAGGIVGPVGDGSGGAVIPAHLRDPLSAQVLSEIEIEALRAARLAFKQMRYDDVFEWVKGNWRKAGMWQRERDMNSSRERLGEDGG